MLISVKDESKGANGTLFILNLVMVHDLSTPTSEAYRDTASMDLWMENS